MGKNYDIIFSKCLYLRRPKVVSFADIIKIAPMFIKTISKNSKKLSRNLYTFLIFFK